MSDRFFDSLLAGIYEGSIDVSFVESHLDVRYTCTLVVFDKRLDKDFKFEINKTEKERFEYLVNLEKHRRENKWENC